MVLIREQGHSHRKHYVTPPKVSVVNENLASLVLEQMSQARGINENMEPSALSVIRAVLPTVNFYRLKTKLKR